MSKLAAEFCSINEIFHLYQKIITDDDNNQNDKTEAQLLYERILWNLKTFFMTSFTTPVSDDQRISPFKIRCVKILNCHKFTLVEQLVIYRSRKMKEYLKVGFFVYLL